MNKCKGCFYEGKGVFYPQCKCCRRMASDNYTIKPNMPTVKDLAEFLCKLTQGAGVECDDCLASKYCHPGRIGFIDLLNNMFFEDGENFEDGDKHE